MRSIFILCSVSLFCLSSSFISVFNTYILLTFVSFFLISFFLLFQLRGDILGSDAFDDVLHSVLQRPSHRAWMRPNNGCPSQRRTNWWTFRLIIIIITTYEEFHFHYFDVEWHVTFKFYVSILFFTVILCSLCFTCYIIRPVVQSIFSF